MDVLIAVVVGAVGGGIIAFLWMSESVPHPAKGFGTALTMLGAAGLLGLIVPVTAGSGPAHEAKTIIEAVGAIAASPLGMFVVLSGLVGAVVTGALMDREDGA